MNESHCHNFCLASGTASAASRPLLKKARSRGTLHCLLTSVMTYSMYEWATADSSRCARSRLASCAPLRVATPAACAAACAESVNCSHAAAVVRASTWCYFRTGSLVWVSLTRCAQRQALAKLKPVVLVLSGRSVVRWPDLVRLPSLESSHVCGIAATLRLLMVDATFESRW